MVVVIYEYMYDNGDIPNNIYITLENMLEIIPWWKVFVTVCDKEKVSYIMYSVMQSDGNRSCTVVVFESFNKACRGEDNILNQRNIWKVMF